ncbi:hypothetical protein IHQ56_00985 [Methylobacillus flagellatus]|uniref:hypothetical protein n=1 Tax=Methylobacillus flagellatus TaxID=405 RepID=UPI002853AD79|nr:hypothetical protein [Methylobacillus flagellatus]MDR5170384.1 hypothetical protein [Methylobacillus flagellatus]
MHTLIVLGGGFALLITSLLLGHAWGNGISGLLTGAKTFIPLWLICSSLNMWIGVQHGYSWGEEFPIFLAILAFPIIVASLIWWKIA